MGGCARWTSYHGPWFISPARHHMRASTFQNMRISKGTPYTVIHEHYITTQLHEHYITTQPSAFLPSLLLLPHDLVRILFQLLSCLQGEPVLHKVDQCNVDVPPVRDEYTWCTADRAIRLVCALKLREATHAEDVRACESDGQKRK
jgi:hypothetical protein